MGRTRRVAAVVIALAVSAGLGTAAATTNAAAVTSAATRATGPASAVVTRPTPWRAGDPSFVPPARKPRYVGVNYHAMWSDLSDPGRATMLDRYAAAGVQWVRIDVSWASIQPAGPGRYDLNGGVAKLAKRLDEVNARGMKALVMFYWPPAWASGTTAKNGVPRDPEQFGIAAAWLAARFAGRLQAIELWNEPDLSAFLANRSVVTYTDLLRAAYPRIKAANPQMFVVAGAPTGINTDWYRRMYANGGAHMFDALGIHPYLGNTDEPPTACDARYLQYYPCNIANLVRLMTAHGDGSRQIWATEYGWSTHDNSTYTAPIPSWKRGVTYANQAKYLIQMQEVLARWPQVTNSFWYTDRNTANHDAQEANFGLLHRAFSPKPAYYAMKCVASGICGSTTTRAVSSYVARGSAWKVDDRGANLGNAWRNPSYADTGWRTASTQAGYGDGDERTLLRWGSEPNHKHLTYYFRKRFDAGASISGVTALRLRGIVDDGAVLYLNGREIWRFNLPAGPISATTRASHALYGAGERTWRTATLHARALQALRPGNNTLAVEVHNNAGSSSDISLDLELMPVR